MTDELTPDHAEAQRKVLNRLKRARGQLDAVIRAVEEGRHCRDIVTQLAAVNSALQRAGFSVISTAMRECVTGDGDEEQVKELEKLFLSLS
ncbi:metal-sensitive transcriptional regulator [Actinomyces culturomici]|uniref:metal-sensitive transcriptional regulator n=1 Tax=Actinomyces culturomici TaxID=1926276 RepID=UPI001C55416E|nr:metal-sensitive transcriptional regulator [Actinomyces culturomici]